MENFKFGLKLLVGIPFILIGAYLLIALVGIALKIVLSILCFI